MRRVFSFLYYFVCASLFFSVTALAYIDPSAMTYIIQIIAGVAIAAGAAFSFYFRKLRRRFSRFGKKKDYAAFCEDETDDDDIGFGDYEIEGASASAETAAASFAAEQAAAASGVREPAPGMPFSGVREPASGAAFSDMREPVPGVSFSAAGEPVFDAKGIRPDPYDEAGGEGGLIAENRELKRLLAQERRNVEALKQALHICTAPRR